MNKDEEKSLQTANEQLLSCPFCGHRAFIKYHQFHGLQPTYGAECTFCGAMSFPFNLTMGEAVAAWNERTERNNV